MNVSLMRGRMLWETFMISDMTEKSGDKKLILNIYIFQYYVFLLHGGNMLFLALFSCQLCINSSLRRVSSLHDMFPIGHINNKQLVLVICNHVLCAYLSWVCDKLAKYINNFRNLLLVLPYRRFIFVYVLIRKLSKLPIFSGTIIEVIKIQWSTKSMIGWFWKNISFQK